MQIVILTKIYTKKVTYFTITVIETNTYLNDFYSSFPEMQK